MRSIVPFLIALATLFAAPVNAQVLSTETWVEEWDETSQQWVRLSDSAERFVAEPTAHEANAQAATPFGPRNFTPPAIPAIAEFGPFRVLDGETAALVDVTDRTSPQDFAAMMEAYPGIDTLRLVEAPGTEHDRANMRLGRMIRGAGLTTHVPDGGSVRSGAVELFLAGVERQVDDGAEFAVHSWMDIYGRQPQDFAPGEGPNRIYLDYYREMGMDEQQAADFYAMTNSVGFAQAKWLDAAEMRGWLGEAEAPAQPRIAPKIAFANDIAAGTGYLDLNVALP